MSEQLFKLGFTNLDLENNAIKLQVQGQIPLWLSGTLFRNGPAKFKADEISGWHTHWFDGLAMLHKFSFDQGIVLYSNRYLRTRAYNTNIATGQFHTGFGSTGGKKIQDAYNTNINVSKINDHFVALTESPEVIEFNPINLDTVDVSNFDDNFPGQLTTAHPHYDLVTGKYINFTTQFERTHMYHLYSITPNSRKRHLIGTIPTDRPAYMHSFANTEHYIILAEFPLIINPHNMMNEDRSLLENFVWKPEQGTLFRVVRKSDGVLLQTIETEAFFSFHHVNAYEIDGGLVLDMCALPDEKMVHNLQVNNLIGETSEELYVQLRRYTLSFASNYTKYEVISSESIDLPTINYDNFSGRPYSYMYGISTNKEHYENYPNQLAKADVIHGSTKIWNQAGCYPGEPIFVKRPNATSEDDGVILSVVLDSKNAHSFLLILDAQSFEELGRANVSHHIPFGFHGMYTEEWY